MAATVPALGATGVLYAGPLLMALLDRDPAQSDVRVSSGSGSGTGSGSGFGQCLGSGQCLGLGLAGAQDRGKDRCRHRIQQCLI